MGFKIATQRRSSRRANPPIMRTSSRVRRSQAPTDTLQRAIGNSATSRLLKSGSLQPKLTVSEPGDPYEREADRVADQVMRMPEPLSRPAVAPVSPTLQSACPKCEDELHRKPEFEKDGMPEEDDGIVQARFEGPLSTAPPQINRACEHCEDDSRRKTPAALPETEEEKIVSPKREPGSLSAPQGGGAVINREELDRLPKADDVEARQAPLNRTPTSTLTVTNPVADNIKALKGGGSPLPGATRAFFEPRFGADFRRVRIHTDSRAVDTTKSINARAFTVGQDIAFSAGRYAPDSHDGRQLLAHELTHVMQQSGEVVSDLAPTSPVTKTHRLVQRWEGLEHKTVGNRAQNKFPYRGTIAIDKTALRSTPRKDPADPHSNTKADILKGAKVLAVGEEKGWVQVLVESGNAQDKKGKIVSAQTLTGYISRELVTKSEEVFDAAVPVGGGLNLSYGDLVAFGGDHFKNMAQIAGEASTAMGRARIKKLRDLTDSEATQSPKYEEGSTISQEYADRYKSLALENVSHFSHGGSALATWQQMHSEAIIEALNAGKTANSAGLAKAYAHNAFADHFLTDSFSAGHVRVPREGITLYYKKLARDVFQHIIDHVSNRLGTRIFELLQQDSLRVREGGGEAERQRAVADVRARITQEIINAGGPAAVQETFGLYVAGAVSKILHDLENEQGLSVISKKHPEGWTAFGDAKLNVPANAKNLEYITAAVQASKQDILKAFNIGLDVFTKHGKTPPQTAIDAAMVAITKKVGPPYASPDFVPGPAPGVKALPAWEWGRLDKTVRTKLLGLIGQYLTTAAQNELLNHFPPTEEVEIPWGPNVNARPRDAARDILNEFLANPIRFLEQAFGRPATP